MVNFSPSPATMYAAGRRLEIGTRRTGACSICLSRTTRSAQFADWLATIIVQVAVPVVEITHGAVVPAIIATIAVIVIVIGVAAVGHIPGVALIAIVAANSIADQSANHRAGDRSARVATRSGIADETAANRTNRGTGITTALAVRRFRCDRCQAQRKRCEGNQFCVLVCHLP